MPEPITDIVGEGSTFGPHFDMAALRREDGTRPNGIILGTRVRGVFHPRRLLLPHQLYVKTFEQLKAEFAEEVWVMPIFGSFTEVWTQVKLPE